MKLKVTAMSKLNEHEKSRVHKFFCEDNMKKIRQTFNSDEREREAEVFRRILQESLLSVSFVHELRVEVDDEMICYGDMLEKREEIKCGK